MVSANPARIGKQISRDSKIRAFQYVHVHSPVANPRRYCLSN
jgi:hypothetical protein